MSETHSDTYNPIFEIVHHIAVARGSVVGCGTMLQAGRSRDRIPMRWIFFNLPNPSNPWPQVVS
jgi:hypothetical protein